MKLCYPPPVQCCAVLGETICKVKQGAVQHIVQCSLLCSIFCSAAYCAVQRIVQCSVLCSAAYCAVQRIVQCSVLCSAAYCAVQRIVQCSVLCSAVYCAVQCTVQCTPGMDTFHHTEPLSPRKNTLTLLWPTKLVKCPSLGKLTYNSKHFS